MQQQYVIQHACRRPQHQAIQQQQNETSTAHEACSSVTLPSRAESHNDQRKHHDNDDDDKAGLDNGKSNEAETIRDLLPHTALALQPEQGSDTTTMVDGITMPAVKRRRHFKQPEVTADDDNRNRGGGTVESTSAKRRRITGKRHP